MIIAFDTEATDLTPGQICQLSYLMIDRERVSGKNFYFAVDEMSEGSLEVHGLSREALEELSGGVRFEDAADEIFGDFSSAKLLVGHNVAFDERYIRVEFTRCGLNLKRINTFCTMNYFSAIMKMKRKVDIGRPKPPKLEELVVHYDLSDETVLQRAAEWFGGGLAAHDARFDTAATYLCLAEATVRGDVRGVL